MKNDKSRLDVPGFAFGIKTGEFIDVPRIYGGRPTPKRSGIPHTLVELSDSVAISRSRKGKLAVAKIRKEDYCTRKRARSKASHKAITIGKPTKACPRRFLEFLGKRVEWLPYEEEPELFVSRAKTAYEITDGLCPMVTVTSAREAILICMALAQYGIASYFNKIVVPRI